MFWQKLSLKTSILIILCTGFLVYANILGNGFVWDDEEQIVNNGIIKNLVNLPFLFSTSTFNTGGAPTLSGAYYKPLMPLVFMLNFAIFGLHAFWFHLFQLLIHLTNAVLIFLITRYLFQKEFKKKTADLMALFTALFFVIHPGPSEAVVYLSATQDVLFAFFGLLSFLLLIKTKIMPAFLCLLFSLLSKESGIVFMPLLFFYLLFFNRRKIVSWILGSAGVLGFYLFLRLVIAKISFATFGIAPIAQANLLTRLTTLPFEIFSYLRLSLFPLKLFVSQHQIISSANQFQFWGYLILEIFLILLIIFYATKTKSKLFIFFFLWLILSITPALNLIPLDMTVAERWLYFPLAGLLGMTAVIIQNLTLRFPQIKGFSFSFLIILLSVFSLRTFWRTFNWRNGLTLYTHDLNLNSRAYDLQNNLGVELYRQGQSQEALAYFETSIKLSPQWWINYNNAAVSWQDKGELEKAKNYYQKAIDNGDYFLAWENLAFLKARTETAQSAWEFIQKGLAKLPYNSRLCAAAALTNYRLGENEKALTFAKKAYNLNPNQQSTYILKAIMNHEEIKF